MRMPDLLRYLVAAFGLLLCSLVSVSVLGRSFVSFRFPGSDELATLIGVWLFFIGMVMASYNGSHITGGIGELITRSRRSNLLRKLLVEICVVVIIGYVAYLAVTYTWFTYEIGRRTSYFRIPTWLVTLSMSAGVSAMLLLSLNSLRRLAAELLKSGRG